MTEAIQKLEPTAMDGLRAMAKAIVASKMFGVQNEDQAVGLMLICQANGMHPAVAVQRFHIIQGKAAYKSERLLADFQSRGGTVEWIVRTATECKAVFASKGCPKGVEVCWTLDDAKRAGITNKPTWAQYPRQMLAARVVAEGVRATDPGCTDGLPVDVEIESYGTPPATLQEVSAEAEKVPEKITFDQRKMLTKAAKAMGYATSAEVLNVIAPVIAVDSTSEIPADKFDEVMKLFVNELST